MFLFSFHERCLGKLISANDVFQMEQHDSVWMSEHSRAQNILTNNSDFCDFPLSLCHRQKNKSFSLFCILSEQQGQEAEYYCTCSSFPNKKAKKQQPDHKEQEEWITVLCHHKEKRAQNTSTGFYVKLPFSDLGKAREEENENYVIYAWTRLVQTVR